jgi:hypothetical protein
VTSPSDGANRGRNLPLAEAIFLRMTYTLPL